MVSIVSTVDVEDLVIIEKYVFLGQQRYRVQVKGTNIVFNVVASSDEEAIEKTIKLASKTGLSREVIELIRERLRQ